MNNTEADLENFQRETANFLLDNMISDMRLLMSYGYPQTELVNLLVRDLETSTASIQVLLAMAGYTLIAKRDFHQSRSLLDKIPYR